MQLGDTRRPCRAQIGPDPVDRNVAEALVAALGRTNAKAIVRIRMLEIARRRTGDHQPPEVLAGPNR